MTAVLIDTSVWIDHFRRDNAALRVLLAQDGVVVHPLVVGELACGTPPRRAQTLADLQDLPQAQAATLREVLAFIERENLAGLGCGLVGLMLLASTLLTPGLHLWTLDQRLATLAARFKVLHEPAPL